MEKTFQNLNFDEKSYQSLLNGVTKVEKAVCSTLGPNGSNVLIEKQFGSAQSTKDGVSVIKQITLKDPIENIACQILKEASARTAETVGDGTTTTIALASSLYQKSLKYSGFKYNKFKLKNAIESAVDDVIQNLKLNSKKLEGNDSIVAVASISANNDKQIGELISKAFSEVGKDGVITVSDSNTAETTLELSEGMEIDKGYISPHFVTDTSKLTCSYKDPFIFVTDKKITLALELVPFLQFCAQNSRPAIILAEDVVGEALSLLILNKMRGMQICAIKLPGFGDRKREVAIDLCTLLSAKFVDDSTPSISNLTDLDFKAILGSCDTLNVYRDKSAFIGGLGSTDDINNRIEYIRNQINDAKSDYDKEKLRERASKLSGGVAIIKVGAPTEVEMKSKKDRVEDSVSATRAAIDEGVSIGGGVALLNCSKYAADKANKSKDEYERIGYTIVAESINYPFMLILSHLDDISRSNVINKLKNNELCYDGITGQIVNGFEKGIIDPTKVIRIALQNAVSVATTLLITNCVITNETYGCNESCNCQNDQ